MRAPSTVAPAVERRSSSRRVSPAVWVSFSMTAILVHVLPRFSESFAEIDCEWPTCVCDGPIRARRDVYADAAVCRYEDDIEGSLLQHPRKASLTLAECQRVRCVVPRDWDGRVDAFFVMVRVAFVLVERE